MKNSEAVAATCHIMPECCRDIMKLRKWNIVNGMLYKLINETWLEDESKMTRSPYSKRYEHGCVQRQTDAKKEMKQCKVNEGCEMLWTAPRCMKSSFSFLGWLTCPGPASDVQDSHLDDAWQRDDVDIFDSFPGTSTMHPHPRPLYILSYWHVDNMLHLVYQTITEYQFHLLSTDQHSECRLKTTMKPSCNRRACLPRSGSAPVATLDASDTATPKLAMIETRDEQNRSSLPSCSLPSVSLFMLFSHHHRHGGGTASVTTEELLRHRQF